MQTKAKDYGKVGDRRSRDRRRGHVAVCVLLVVVAVVAAVVEIYARRL